MCWDPAMKSQNFPLRRGISQILQMTSNQQLPSIGIFASNHDSHALHLSYNINMQHWETRQIYSYLQHHFAEGNLRMTN